MVPAFIIIRVSGILLEFTLKNKNDIDTFRLFFIFYVTDIVVYYNK